MTRSSMRRIARKKQERANRPKFVDLGLVEDGASYHPHPAGGIVLCQPSQPPVWIKDDGTREELQP